MLFSSCWTAESNMNSPNKSSSTHWLWGSPATKATILSEEEEEEDSLVTVEEHSRENSNNGAANKTLFDDTAAESADKSSSEEDESSSWEPICEPTEPSATEEETTDTTTATAIPRKNIWTRIFLLTLIAILALTVCDMLSWDSTTNSSSRFEESSTTTGNSSSGSNKIKFWKKAAEKNKVPTSKHTNNDSGKKKPKEAKVHKVQTTTTNSTIKICDKFPWISLDDDVLNFSNFWEVDVKDILLGKQLVLSNFYNKPSSTDSSSSSSVESLSPIIVSPKAIMEEVMDLDKPTKENTRTAAAAKDKKEKNPEYSAPQSATKKPTTSINVESKPSDTSGTATANANNKNAATTTAPNASAATSFLTPGLNNKTPMVIRFYRIVRKEYRKLLQALLRHKEQLQEKQQQHVFTIYNKIFK